MLASSPFDILAKTYDADFTQSQIGTLQRNRVWQLLDTVLAGYPHPLKILEINCGTGEDALRLAEMGHTVIATDASERMVEKGRQKLYNSGFISGRIKFIQSTFSDLKHHFANEKFDLVFSNFGGINCIDKNEIAKLSEDLSAVVSSEGCLFLTVMSRFCLWEIFYYSLKGKFNIAFRRQKKSVQFNVNGSSMPIFLLFAPESKKTVSVKI